MPQIREQIAMVHLPPSKTLKYLFHVRKTTKTRHGFAMTGFCYVIFRFYLVRLTEICDNIKMQEGI